MDLFVGLFSILISPIDAMQWIGIYDGETNDNSISQNFCFHLRRNVTWRVVKFVLHISQGKCVGSTRNDKENIQEDKLSNLEILL